ncbi:hypothetical protein pdam_00007002 [Pocillopora damicornis]|uniref:ZP-C domain-containing protein n=1 Tax=Pocillopora damicornis TaxID=46731 RepID=A0A3M6UUT9_POCDA|nr:hypothetical protein pdam_00007002 [Pocillopora damicornis]
MTTCRTPLVPKPHRFNCGTQALHCPQRKDSHVTVGLFVSWPTKAKCNQSDPGPTTRANNTRQGEIQVGIFSNNSFTKEYEYIRFPIHLDVNSNVFVEVEATEKGQIAITKECHVSAFKNYNHNPVLEYGLIEDFCPDKNELSYLESNAVSQAVRFKFPIRQYFGIAEQFLFIHFKVTICRRKQPPKMTAINCKTLAQFCPHRREETIMTVGPFVVLPEEANLVEHVVIPKKCRLSRSKNFTDHLSTKGYTLLEDSCPLGLEFDYLPTRNRAVRFRFTFDHFYASAKECLYLHCLMITCQRKEVPRMMRFNCLTQTQYCPHHRENEVTMGPFMVWPEECNQGEESLDKKTVNSNEFKGANSSIFGEVQVELFSNYSFTEDVKYNRFPIHLDLSSLVFVEVEAIWQELVAIPKECHVTAYKNCSDHHPNLGYKLIFD